MRVLGTACSAGGCAAAVAPRIRHPRRLHCLTRALSLSETHTSPSLPFILAAILVSYFFVPYTSVGLGLRFFRHSRYLHSYSEGSIDGVRLSGVSGGFLQPDALQRIRTVSRWQQCSATSLASWSRGCHRTMAADRAVEAVQAQVAAREARVRISLSSSLPPRSAVRYGTDKGALHKPRRG